MNDFGINDDLIFGMAKPYIIWLVVYTVTFAASTFLNLKKKYIPNVIFLSVMFVIFIFLSVF
jgi:hypothetical protein